MGLLYGTVHTPPFPRIPFPLLSKNEWKNLSGRKNNFFLNVNLEKCDWMYFQQPEGDLELDLLVPDYSQQVWIILLIPLNLNSQWLHLPQQIEGIEAMLGDQTDRGQVKNSTLADIFVWFWRHPSILKKHQKGNENFFLSKKFYIYIYSNIRIFATLWY